MVSRRERPRRQPGMQGMCLSSPGLHHLGRSPAHPRPQPLSLQPQCHVCSAPCEGRPVLSISAVPNQIQSWWTGNSSRWKLRPAPPTPCQCQARLSRQRLQVMNRDLPNRWIFSCRWMRRSSQALSPRGDSECGICHVCVLCH